MKKALFLCCVVLFLNGCKTDDIVIDPVKSWEGHYYTKEEFFSKTSTLTLDKKESVWVLSNRTLKRVLKN